MEWNQAISHFSSNYAKIQEYYMYLADHSLEKDARCYFSWMHARSSRLTGLPYEKYKYIYARAYEKFPDRIEALFELSQHAPQTDRIRLLRECIYKSEPPSSTRWVTSDIYRWKALKNYVAACKEVGKTHESYDAWQMLMQREDLIPEIDLRDCRESGQDVRDLLFVEHDSYSIFRRQLKDVSDLVVGGIPNVIHIMWILGHRTYSMIQYLTVKIAYDVQHPTKIYIYNDVEPENNEWWEKTKAYAEIVHITPPKFVNNNKIPWAQHVADLMRVWIMYTRGGIYLDADLMLVKPLDSVLIPGTLTMCQETTDKIWNGFLAAPPRHDFFERWIHEYETKYGTAEGGCWWAGLSVITPMRLYKADSQKINLVPTHTFLPFGIHDDTFYSPTGYVEGMYSNSLGIHLCETEAEKRGVLPKTTDYFKQNPNTGFSRFFGKHKE